MRLQIRRRVAPRQRGFRMKTQRTAAVIAFALCFAAAVWAEGTKRKHGELTTTSWNVENVTARNLTGPKLDAICSAIVNNPSEVTFLQEILADPDGVGSKIVDRLQKKYDPNVTWSYVYTDVGKEGTRNEYGLAIVRSKPNVKLKIDNYGILDRKNMYAAPQDLIFRSAMGSSRTAEQVRQDGPSVIGNRVPFVVYLTVERPGLAPEQVVLSNWHAPGPQSGNGADLFAVFQPVLEKIGVAITSGDFNYESNGRATVERPTTRGGKAYDGVVLLDSTNYKVIDVTPSQGFDFRYLDHRAVRVRVEVYR